MDFHHDGIRLTAELLHHPVGREKRAFGLRVHETPPQHGEHREPEPAGFNDEVVPTGARLGQVSRSANMLNLPDLVFPAPLIPDVIAQGDGIDPRFENRLCDRAGNSGPRRGILAIGDDEIDRMLRPDTGEPVGEYIATGPSHDIADKEQFQHGPNLRSPRRSANQFSAGSPGAPARPANPKLASEHMGGFCCPAVL